MYEYNMPINMDKNGLKASYWWILNLCHKALAWRETDPLCPTTAQTLHSERGTEYKYHNPGQSYLKSNSVRALDGSEEKEK